MASRRLVKLSYLKCFHSHFTAASLANRVNPSLVYSRSISTSLPCSNIPASPPSASKQVYAPNEPKDGQRHLPPKEVLLTIDWILEGLAPKFMKAPLQPIFEKMEQEVNFVDEIYGYKVKGISQLGVHITKIRTYFRWKSPYNKLVHKGSYLFEDDDFVVVLYGFETIDSSFLSYFPSFITGKEDKSRILEGALQFTVSPQGKITKIVNRKITENDIEMAQQFGELKKSENDRFDREDRKAAEAELKDKIERQEV